MISGSEALMRALEHQGVKTIFGYPGGSIMPVYDALYDHTDKSRLQTALFAMRCPRLADIPAVQQQPVVGLGDVFTSMMIYSCRITYC